MRRRSQEPFRHPALFYRSTDAYLTGLMPFLTEGLAAAEPVAVAVPDDNGRALRSELGLLADRVRWIDLTVAGRNPGWIIPGVLRPFADQHKRRPVRIVGEPVWPTHTPEEYPACVLHEALIIRAFKKHYGQTPTEYTRSTEVIGRRH